MKSKPQVHRSWLDRHQSFVITYIMICHYLHNDLSLLSVGSSIFLAKPKEAQIYHSAANGASSKCHKQILELGVLPQLSGIFCAYQPDLNTMYTIYALFINSKICATFVEKKEKKQKGRVWAIINKIQGFFYYQIMYSDWMLQTGLPTLS